MPEVDVLAVGAHPDDVELGCGGTLLVLRHQGKRAGVVDLTRGELGSRGTSEQREREARQAARRLGLVFRENLGLPDGSVRSTQEARLALVEIVRACRPALVITHSATGHPDHWEACRLVREAVHHAGLARIETGSPRHRPDQIAFWIEFRQNRAPEVVVDVSAVYDAKEELLRCYSSQLHDSRGDQPETYLSRPGFLDQIRAQCRHYGSLAECTYGEGFLFMGQVPETRSLGAAWTLGLALDLSGSFRLGR